MRCNNKRRIAKSAFVSPKKTPSMIIDRFETTEKLANSDEIRRPTRQGQRKMYSKLSMALANDKEKEIDYREREIPTRVQHENDHRKVYHDFCVEFAKKAESCQEKFDQVTQSAKQRNNELSEEKDIIIELQREAYRLEMGLGDPPKIIKENDFDSSYLFATKTAREEEPQ